MSSADNMTNSMVDVVESATGELGGYVGSKNCTDLTDTPEAAPEKSNGYVECQMTPDLTDADGPEHDGYIEGKIAPDLTDTANGCVDPQMRGDITDTQQESNGYVAPKNCGDLTKGLSKLQRWMLEHARLNQIAEKRDADSRGADLYYSEVLAGFYGFPYKLHNNQDYNNLRYCPGNQHFQPEVIGRAKYNAACAAISRAALRLNNRGLAVCVRGAIGHWSGINLADAVTASAPPDAEGGPA